MKNTQKIVLIGLLCLTSIFTFGQDLLLFVGTYTTKTSEGIYGYRFNPKTGDFALPSIAKGIENPSFLAISPNQHFLYAVEGRGELVRAFR